MRAKKRTSEPEAKATFLSLGTRTDEGIVLLTEGTDAACNSEVKLGEAKVRCNLWPENCASERKKNLGGGHCGCTHVAVQRRGEKAQSAHEAEAGLLCLGCFSARVAGNIEDVHRALREEFDQKRGNS